jgi:hypothetical protein
MKMINCPIVATIMMAVSVTVKRGGVLLYTFLKLLAESISILLDIEAHTRRAAVILEQRLP